MLICVNNQTIEWPTKTSNREKLVTLIAITEATGGLSNPIRKETLTRTLRFYPNQFHTSAMKKERGKTSDTVFSAYKMGFVPNFDLTDKDANFAIISTCVVKIHFNHNCFTQLAVYHQCSVIFFQTNKDSKLIFHCCFDTLSNVCEYIATLKVPCTCFVLLFCIKYQASSIKYQSLFSIPYIKIHQNQYQ